MKVTIQRPLKNGLRVRPRSIWEDYIQTDTGKLDTQNWKIAAVGGDSEETLKHVEIKHIVWKVETE